MLRNNIKHDYSYKKLQSSKTIFFSPFRAAINLVQNFNRVLEQLFRRSQISQYFENVISLI